ncbi:MAG: transketolase family protein [Chloroflexi bacterium]|jgi:transketolase|nr:transketolase family protein [Chloroflexota bacterium]
MSELYQTRFVYGEALAEAAECYSEVVALDADLYTSTRTVTVRERFPERFLDLGISEMDMVSTAAGLAASGLVPFANSFAMFITAHCYDQIRIQICYPSLHVILAGSSGGLTQGPDGASHQSLEDVALMRALPSMTVLAPADAIETRAMTLAAVRSIRGPVYLRLGRYPVPNVLPSGYTFELGKATWLREGANVALLAYGHMVWAALRAADLLATQGVQASVVNMSTIKPLDTTAVRRAATASLVVTVEEHSIVGGLGSAVAEVLAEMPVQHARGRLLRLGTRDVFGESGLADELLAKHGLTPEGISAAVLAAL